MGSSDQFMCQKIFLFVGSLWLSLSTYLLPLFRFIIRHFFSVQKVGNAPNSHSSCSIDISKEENQTESNFVESEPAPKQRETLVAAQFDDALSRENVDLGKDSAVKEEKIDLEPGSAVTREENFDLEPDSAVTKEENTDLEPYYAAKENEDLRGDGFCEKEKSSSFCFTFKFPTFEEFCRKLTHESELLDQKGLSRFVEHPEVQNSNVEEHCSSANENEISEDGLLLFNKGFVQPDPEVEAVGKEETSSNGKNTFSDDTDAAIDDFQIFSEMDYFASDSDSESMNSSREFSVLSHLIDSNSEVFLSDKEVGGAFEFESDDAEKGQLSNWSFIHHQSHDSKEKKVQKSEEPSCSSEKSGKINMQISCGGDSEDSNGLETLWEHQDLIEQLKMELRKVRATGLPTILEESESPKIMDDLKPWKIDEKFQQENPMDELHKFYKSYRERMRKLDILNYQKMYAIGFLQLKDPFQSMSSRRSSGSAITSVLSQNFRVFRRKKIECDPMVKFAEELYNDLEVVYVGHLCLSWEFLHWQYEKALELWESDPHSVRRYNEVAGEFQQFQVLMQRLIEDEPFQGPRVQNYVKTRCVLRNLLQVPVIKEDCLKGGKKARIQTGNEGITSYMLVEIVEECIRIFWRFVRADKDTTSVNVSSRNMTQIELQDPSDYELLMGILTNLHKKEKKLKDILRTGNCILKRFQKNQDDGSDQVLYFFSQVDMKLVSRVLNMSRITTDQLAWCHSKLSKINFVNRKIHVEPSFLLFPC